MGKSYAQTHQELLSMQQTAEGCRRIARDREAEVATLKAQQEETKTALADAQQKVEDSIAIIDHHKEKNKRLEEERAVLKKRVARSGIGASGGGGGATMLAALEEELKESKSMMRCTVCNDRPKDTVIAKCFHTFCNQCIRTNLEIRKRRCPGCAKPFSESDVHAIYLGFA
eukprot:TRINITY_DN3947_c0_g1_i6.p1 TRINITY_DN3947_c0_g1~~TRINITY_DN3947_c0_g1_i6.p1  ORF type:complete len:171 (-),score=39.56 TRINITY_DN3947_c0_g1_i6:25-537(-)